MVESTSLAAVMGESCAGARRQAIMSSPSWKVRSAGLNEDTLRSWAEVEQYIAGTSVPIIDTEMRPACDAKGCDPHQRCDGRIL